MKVLLLHEMSGVHTELRAGLRELGVEADIATYGDSWKKYNTDIFLGNISGKFSHFERVANQFTNISKFKKYDIIQTISPNPFTRPFDNLLNKLIFQGGPRVIYVAAGSDAVYRKHVKALPYYPPHDWYENSKEFKRFTSLLKYVKKVIPVCYEYKYAMEKEGRHCEDIIPFPIKLTEHKFNITGKNKKIKFFHPLNRDNYENFDFKGTKIIKEVFGKLNAKYSDVAEFLMAGGMPHHEYSKLTDSVDVIVDQLYSMSYGMSAAYGLAKGKVVISGLEDLAKQSSYHYANCPIINAKPDTNDLFEKLEHLILNPHEISALSEKGRNYAEKFHDHKIVAEKYLNCYMGQVSSERTY